MLKGLPSLLSYVFKTGEFGMCDCPIKDYKSTETKVCSRKTEKPLKSSWAWPSGHCRAGRGQVHGQVTGGGGGVTPFSPKTQEKGCIFYNQKYSCQVKGTNGDLEKTILTRPNMLKIWSSLSPILTRSNKPGGSANCTRICSKFVCSPYVNRAKITDPPWWP